MNNNLTVGLVIGLINKIVSRTNTGIKSIVYDREQGNNLVFIVTFSDDTTSELLVPINNDFETIYVLRQGSTDETDNGNYRILINPVSNDLEFSKREGGQWVFKSSVGSLVTSDFIIEDLAGTVAYNDPDGNLRTILKPSVTGRGSVIGEPEGRVAIVHDGDILSVIVDQTVLTDIINAGNTEMQSGTEFEFEFTSTRVEAFVGGAAELSGVAEGTTMRLSVTDENGSDIAENNTESEFVDGNAQVVTDGDQSIEIARPFAVPEGFVFILKLQFSEAVNVLGSTIDLSDGRGSRFVPKTAIDFMMGYESMISTSRNVVDQIEAKTGDERLDFEALKNTPSDLTNINVVQKNASYTATAADFDGFSHTVFIFTNTSQVDLIIPADLMQNDNIWSVKMFSGADNPSNRVLLQATGGGKIDNETDHLITDGHCLGCIHIGGNEHRILYDLEEGENGNNYVMTALFDDNILRMDRLNLPTLNATLEIHDVDNEVEGLPHVEPLNLVATGTTRQVLNFGSLPFDFASLVGGVLGVQYKIITHSQGGFEPDFISMSLDYGSGHNFVFDISGHELDVINYVEQEIANIDYSNIYGVDPIVMIDVDVRGFQFVGEFEFMQIYNREKSIIHDEIVTLADIESAKVQQELEPLINNNRVDIIAILKSLVAINDRLDHQLFSLPSDVISWLTNDIQISDHPTTTLEPTLYNRGLASDQSQAIEFDSKASESGTDFVSGAINDGGVRGQKLIETTFGNYDDDKTIIQANDGVSVTTPLVKRSGDNLVGIRFVEAVAPGTRLVEHFPVPTNLFKHDWYTIAGHTANLAALANELFFTQDIPNEAVTLNVNYRYLANGTAGPTQTLAIANVGGPTNTSNTVSLALPDGETIELIIDWQAAQRRIRVEAIPRANNPNFFIFDTQINMNYEVTETVPGTPATTEEVVISSYSGPFAILFKPSQVRADADATTLVIVSDIAEFDTLYTFNELFGNTDDGNLEALDNTNVSIYNWSKFTPATPIMGTILNRIELPFLGWFTQNFGHEVITTFDTQLHVKDSDGNDQDVFNLIQEVGGKLVKATIVEGAGGYELTFTEL